MAADLLRSFWHSLEDPVVRSFQAEATTASLLLLCQSRLNRWMVGTDGSATLEASYRFYHNSAMTVFKSVIIQATIFDITKCPRLCFNSDLGAVVGTLQDLYLCAERRILSRCPFPPQDTSSSLRLRTKTMD